MTKHEAKRILLARRPWTRDDDDPEVAEALALARSDSELQSWLDQQSDFHEAVRTRLRGMAPPSDLKERILARHRVVVPLWRRPEVLLAAACLILALVLAGLWAADRPQWTRDTPKEEQSFANFRSRMVSFAVRLYGMDIVTNDLSEVREFLREHGAPADIALTPGLRSMPVKGGAKLWWQGHPVSMVCFDLTTNQTLYMFVMDQTAIKKGNPPERRPSLAQVGGISTAIWSEGGKVYLVAAATVPSALKKLVDRADNRAPELGRRHPPSIAWLSAGIVPSSVNGRTDQPYHFKDSIVIVDVGARAPQEPIEVFSFILSEREG